MEHRRTPGTRTVPRKKGGNKSIIKENASFHKTN